MSRHTLSPEKVEALEGHPDVKTVLDIRGTSAVLPWDTDTETIRELVDIAGREATVYGGDTRISIVWNEG